VSKLGKQLREQLVRREAILVPGAANALTARIIARIGFPAVYVTGAGVANTFLGAPDIGLVTLTELASHVAAIRESVSCPLIVDADTGFGNPVNVHRTVKALERAGADALQLEDQVFPKRCGHFAGKDVIPQVEMVQKIRSVQYAREDEGLLIIARTDARAVLGFDAAIERAQAYLDAGADASFVEAPQTLEEVEAIPRRLAAPQVYNAVFGGVTPLLDQARLRELNFGLVLYANAALQAAVHGMTHVLQVLKKDGSLNGVADHLASFEERQEVVNKSFYDDLDRRYSGS